MKNALLVLTLCLASSSAFAMTPIDGMRNDISCRLKGSIDGGYDVLISSGGLAPHTEAQLSEFFFNGKQDVLGKYVVSTTKKGDETILADIATSGDTFRLTMNGTPLVGAPVDAKLEANEKTGRISADMECTRLLQTRSMPIVNPKPAKNPIDRIPPILKTLVQCDGGEETQLVIREIPKGVANVMRADLTVQSVGDSYPTFHYTVQESAQKPGAMGGSTEFTGNGFDLTINTDGPGSAQGFRAVLKVTSPKINQVLSCKIMG